jgi:hypothetical protein
MLEANEKAAAKFGIDIGLIKEKADTKKTSKS